MCPVHFDEFGPLEQSDMPIAEWRFDDFCGIVGDSWSTAGDLYAISMWYVLY